MIYITVPGNPVAQPRPSFARKGRAVVAYVPATHAVHAYRRSIAAVARPQLRKPLCGAVTLTIRFFFARPQSHYGRNAKHELLPTAPGPHITRPDIDNLVKAVKDSLTKIIWEDDSQVVQEFATKEYTSGRERTEIEISFVDY